jgi:RND superfamily putative drug exporter
LQNGLKPFAALGRWVVGHPWPVIAAWIVAGVVLVVFSPGLASVTNPDQAAFLPSSSESVQAQNVAQQAFPQQSGASALIVVTARNGGTLTPADQNQVASLAKQLQGDGIPRVESVQTGPQQVSPNGQVQLVAVQFQGSNSDPAVSGSVQTLRDKASSSLSGTPLTEGVTGPAAINADTQTAYAQGEKIVAIATVILILLLLGLIFRSVMIAVLPLLAVGLVYLITTSALALLATALHFQITNILSTLLIVVLFGIGTDYIIFMLFRYREALRAGATVRDALTFAETTAGEVVASAAIVVIAAFSALLLASLGSLRTLAPGLILAVAFMLVAALTLVPAVFSLLGRHLFWPSRSWQRAPTGTLAHRLGSTIARRRFVAAPAAVVLLAGLAVGVHWYAPTYNTLGELPSSAQSQTAYNTLTAAFPPGASNPTYIYVSSSQRINPASLQPLVTKTSQVPGVAKVMPPQLSQSGTTAELTVYLTQNPLSTPALNTIAPLRTATQGTVPGAQVLVGGTTAQLADVRTDYSSDLRLILPVAAGLILVLLALLLRSVIPPVYLVAAVLLGFAATLGLTVLVFQKALNVDGLDFSTPIVLYLFVVAIGTDYNILMSSRLREEFLHGVGPVEGAATAIGRAAPTAAAAATVLAGTFASLLLTGIRSLEEIGFGVAVGILIAAFVMGTSLVPSVTAILGRHAWWPVRSRESPPAS